MFRSIKSKLIIFIFVILAFTTIVNLVATNFIIDDAQKDAAADSIVRAEQVITALVESQKFNLKNYSQIASAQPLLTMVLEDNDFSSAQGMAQGYQEDFNLAVVDIADPYGTVLAQVNPGFSGREKDMWENLFQAAQQGRSTTSMMVRNNQLTLSHFSPIGSPDAPMGILTMGTLWDNAFAAYIKSLTKTDISFIVGQQVVGSSLNSTEQLGLLREIQPQIGQTGGGRSLFHYTESDLFRITSVKDFQGKVLGYLVIQLSLQDANRVQQNIHNLLLVIGIAILILAIFFAYIASNKLTRPMRLLQQNADAIAQGNLDQEIETSRQDEVGKIAKSFATMRDSIRQQIKDLKTLNQTVQEQNQNLEYKVLERTTAIQDLLDNIGQGFLSFGQDYRIHKEYSKACTLFFGESIEQSDVLQLLFAEQESAVKEVLDLLFNGVGDLNLVGELLPKEISLNQRTLAVEYRWISSQSAQEKVMIILTDVTLRRQLEAQLAEDESTNELILKVAGDREGFLQLLKEVGQLFTRIFTLLKKEPKEINVNELFRYYHTLKGGAASFALKDVAESAHAIEFELEYIRKNQKPFTPALIRQITGKTQGLQQQLQQSLDTLGGLLSKEELQGESIKTYRIPENKIKELERVLDTAKGTLQLSNLEKAVYNLRKQPLGTLLKKYESTAQDLAQKLEKQVEVQLKGLEIEVDHEPLESLFSTLIHLVRNSVDHGIETPETRALLGKQEVGKLEIQAIQEADRLKLIIRDDGGGIDAEKIKQIALSKGLISEAEVETYTKEKLMKLIFTPGFSTKEKVTATSGRGVGLDAVQAAIDELGGQLDVISHLNQGSSFELTIPLT
ncbi:MAG: hypothetical protein COB67_06090 [SAR324 cluster bacterium]|uniref:histidine kinase n=1 Tax=SAR324 cluster bacterium TaxID=2024889 RepID=A0A2A4T4J8_9DELT|nr:MAG: hypothetical protein COB67_06090 [SAR324 cluster bacterium]